MDLFAKPYIGGASLLFFVYTSVDKNRLCTCRYTVRFMPPIPSYVLVEASPYSSGLWHCYYEYETLRQYARITVGSNLLPEDICIRAENWSFWFTYELINQGYPYNAIQLDADSFNKVGREIAVSIKSLGVYSVCYRPILTDAGHEKLERIFI